MEKLITITGVNFYLGMKPYKIGRIVRIQKEEDNSYDGEAIRVELPVIGTIGYVANSTKTVYAGTMSAGRIYDEIDNRAYAKVIVITNSSVVAQILPNDKYENYDTIFNVDGIDTE